jgi:thymidylate synthase ThyX
MAFSARVLLDSRSPSGARLTTLEVRYPRFIHSEMMTHRVFSRNAASSRAIPIKKMIAAVREEPALPVYWGRNQTGMSAREAVTPEVEALARAEWQSALEDALAHAERLAEKDIDLHKQLVNRLLEPFAWITVIITATDWANFFTQRCHPDAQPEIKHGCARAVASALDPRRRTHVARRTVVQAERGPLRARLVSHARRQTRHRARFGSVRKAAGRGRQRSLEPVRTRGDARARRAGPIGQLHRLGAIP